MTHKHNGMTFTANAIEFQPFHPRWVVSVTIQHAIPPGAKTNYDVLVEGSAKLTAEMVWKKACTILTKDEGNEEL